MADLNFLTDADVAILVELIRREKNRPVVTSRLQTISHLDFPRYAPEVYVARTQSGGIPALEEQAGTGIIDEAGSALCDIYRVDDDLLTSAGFDQRVYNLATEAVEENRWVLILRDKFGTWFANEPGESRVLIALTPSAGIPALAESVDAGTAFGAGDVPGSAICTIYQITGVNETGTGTGANPSLTATGATKRVHNLGSVAVAGGQWITIIRDDYGEWLVPSQGLRFAQCP